MDEFDKTSVKIKIYGKNIDKKILKKYLLEIKLSIKAMVRKCQLM